MATVVISPCNVVNFLNGGGGHFWVYMQYALGLRLLGCDVYWFEQVRATENADHDSALVKQFLSLMERYGLGGKAILYRPPGERGDEPEFLTVSASEAHDVFRRADLLLNFHYAIDPALLARFRRTALVDIDPGLLQFWMSVGQLHVPRHDVYLTTGETVGTPGALFPDAGLSWRQIRPLVCLEAWPYVHSPDCDAFTTVSNWYGHDDWIVDGKRVRYENTKRISFLEYAELPRNTSQPLELALFLSETEQDVQDRRLMQSRGWRIRHSTDVARTPDAYQAYIQQSRGEFSCAKPSCMKFQNAWVSDRTLCYLASGKPAVVQHTGPSARLPSGEGLFRFQSMAEAADALATINSDYPRHCQAARDIVATHFDAKTVLAAALNLASSASKTP